MHLDSLKIKNFRLLEDIEVKKLGHVNLIVGKNNSGKSTVLEALALLASGFDPDVVKKTIINRKFNRSSSLFENSLDKHGLFQIYQNEFLPYKNHYILNDKPVFLGDDKIYLELKVIPVVNKDNELKSSDKIGKRTIPVVFIDYYKEFQDNLIGFNLYINSSFNNEKTINLQDSVFFQRSGNDLFHQSLPIGYVETSSFNNDILINDWDAIALTDTEDLVVDVLRYIEPNIDKLAFINQDNITRVPFVKLKGVDERVALNSMGEGILRLLHIILNVVKAEHGFLLIDEFENGLHYSVQAEVWRLIFELAKRFDIQVFATTHSWDCIESFAQVAKEREDLDGVLFRMGRSARKSDKGKVIATEFNEDELYNLTKDKIEVR